MNRIRRQSDAEAIAAALDLIPSPIADRLRGVDFLTWTSPTFAGLHAYRDTDDARSYEIVGHVAYPFHQLGLCRAQRATTIVLPTEHTFRVPCIVHEFGHVLDEQLRFEASSAPVTRYAQTNRNEAFAEAFAAWVLPFGHGYGAAKDRLYDRDARTVDLFESLAA